MVGNETMYMVGLYILRYAFSLLSWRVVGSCRVSFLLRVDLFGFVSFWPLHELTSKVMKVCV